MISTENYSATLSKGNPFWLLFLETLVNNDNFDDIVDNITKIKPKKGKRKVQGVPESQTTALPRPHEEEETDKSKQAQTEQTYEKQISSLFPKRGNRNTKRTEKHKNKMTHGKTYNKSPRRINHKATKSKTNTGTTALERSVEQTTGGFKALLQLANFTLGPDATLNTETHKIQFA